MGGYEVIPAKTASLPSAIMAPARLARNQERNDLGNRLLSLEPRQEGRDGGDRPRAVRLRARPHDRQPEDVRRREEVRRLRRMAARDRNSAGRARSGPVGG